MYFETGQRAQTYMKSYEGFVGPPFQIHGQIPYITHVSNTRTQKFDSSLFCLQAELDSRYSNTIHKIYAFHNINVLATIQQ